MFLDSRREDKRFWTEWSISSQFPLDPGLQPYKTMDKFTVIYFLELFSKYHILT
jgi:hypothetical protein